MNLRGDFIYIYILYFGHWWFIGDGERVGGYTFGYTFSTNN